MHKQTHRKQTKKSRKPKRKETPRNEVVVRYGAPQSPVYRTTLTYSTYVDFAFSFANTAFAHQFNANSLYDPDATGVGHQPYYFDQLALAYNRYRVMKIGYKITMASPNDIANSTNEWAALIRNGAYTVSYPDVFEMPFTKRTRTSTNGGVGRLQGGADLTLIEARRAQYLADDRTAATVNATPAEAMFLILAGFSNQANVVRCTVTMTFDAEFFDPVPVGSSVQYQQRVIALAKTYKEREKLQERPVVRAKQVPYTPGVLPPAPLTRGDDE